ncbi:hypothetical protein H7142_02155 [Candidatus Saccharibacteria bacterium]|nr:hypothetical protein [Candidatus Saccharibacteria bacterium]
MSEQPQQFQDHRPRQEATVFDDSASEVQLDFHRNTVSNYNAEEIAAAHLAAELATRSPSNAELQTARVYAASVELRNLQAARRFAQGIEAPTQRAA